MAVHRDFIFRDFKSVEALAQALRDAAPLFYSQDFPEAFDTAVILDKISAKQARLPKPALFCLTELIDNIRKHSEYSASPAGLALFHRSESIEVLSFNRITAMRKTELEEKAASLSRHSLKQLKKRYTQAVQTSPSPNPGLGLIQLMIKTDKEYRHNFIKFEEEIYFLQYIDIS